MKTKYINADKFRSMMYRNAFETDSDLQKWDGGCWIRYKMFEKTLEQIETSDVVEVVRCKDCKYHTDEEPGMVYCLNTIGGWIDENGFCSCGE